MSAFPIMLQFPLGFLRDIQQFLLLLSVLCSISVSCSNEKVTGELCLNPVVVPLTRSLGRHQLAQVPLLAWPITLSIVHVCVCEKVGPDTDGVYMRLYASVVLVNGQLVWMHLISLVLQRPVLVNVWMLCSRWWISSQCTQDVRFQHIYMHCCSQKLTEAGYKDHILQQCTFHLVPFYFIIAKCVLTCIIVLYFGCYVL